MAEIRPSKAKSFTLIFPRTVSSILTDVGVTQPFFTPHPHSEIFAMKALWDTGATHCCMTREAAERAKLPPIGRTTVIGVHGQQERDEYYLNVILPNQVTVSRLSAVECDAVAGSFDVIIGMSVITLGDFAITHPDGKTQFSFQIPSIESIDFDNRA